MKLWLAFAIGLAVMYVVSEINAAAANWLMVIIIAAVLVARWKRITGR